MPRRVNSKGGRVVARNAEWLAYEKTAALAALERDAYARDLDDDERTRLRSRVLEINQKQRG